MNIFKSKSGKSWTAQLFSLDSLYTFLSRKPRMKIAVISSVMLGTVLLSGRHFNTLVKEVATEGFNQQQLMLASHAAEQIKNHIQTLQKELNLLSLSPSVQYYEKTFLARRIDIAFSSLKAEGALEIRYIDASGRDTHVVSDKGHEIVKTAAEDNRYFLWARGETQRNSVFISEVHPSADDRSVQRLLMEVSVPVWQTSVDDAHPIASEKFAGVIVAQVDVTSLIRQVTEGIRSGKTGYAWVIDSNGTFLYHLEKSLIGKNAFAARKEKMPTISFARINEIQKKMMLTGKEGTSWYESGWHRGQGGIMKKLIAYSPIVFDGLAETRIWSVAVVAPASEVEGAIHNIQIQQFLFEGVLIVIVLSSSLFVISLMARWSTSLKQEVSRQTTEFKRSEQKYRSLVENAEDIIFTVDCDGRLTSINSYGIKLLGRDRDEVIGCNISDIFSWPTAEMLLSTIREVFEIKRGRQVTHLVRIGENDIWLNTNFRRLFDEDGNIYAVLGISRNITDRKKMEEQSYYTEKLASMGTLAAGVAHEINNPLTVILGFTDMLLEKTEPGSEMHDILKTIEGQGNKAKKVVDNLLTFARTKEHTETVIDVNKNIGEVLSVMGNNLLIRKISIDTLSLAGDLPAVKGDPDELQQVFWNIINNAVYVMKGGGTLSVSTRTIDEGARVEIRISDTGSGIRPENRKKIFDPLFTTKKVGDGTGLGLSVSYGIITRHRGTITFDTRTREESGSPGTTFIITLPAFSSEPRSDSLSAYEGGQ